MKNTAYVSKVLFYGGLWGLLEATLGHLLQYLPPMVSGMVMFPIAVLILMVVYKNLDSAKALVFVGLVAACIKGVDLLLPGLMPIKTLNPMMAIGIESIVVMLGCKAAVAHSQQVFKSNKSRVYLLMSALFMSISWRGLFAAYIYVQSLFTGRLAQWLSTPSSGINFIVVEGLLASVLVLIAILMGTKATKSKEASSIVRQWVPSLLTVLTAMVVTYLL